jgi:AmmeMemoRadiSam system protein B
MLTRPPAVAGRFYPEAPDVLEQMVERLLDGAASTPAAPERVAGILVPHAGYPYSGPVAAHAFARVRGKRAGRVVLLGRSHHFAFPGASVVCEGAFETPLGLLPIDESFARKLASVTAAAPANVHDQEHALEVELPFLQVALGEVPIVPVLFGSEPSPLHARFGKQLASLLNPDDLVLVSTDLSHYLANSAAHTQDRASLNGLMTQDLESFEDGVITGAYALCGATAVLAGMACASARGATEWRLLDYRTSGDTCGDTSRVVGYAAVSFEYPASRMEN